MASVGVGAPAEPDIVGGSTVFSKRVGASQPPAATDSHWFTVSRRGGAGCKVWHSSTLPTTPTKCCCSHGGLILTVPSPPHPQPYPHPFCPKLGPAKVRHIHSLPCPHRVDSPQLNELQQFLIPGKSHSYYPRSAKEKNEESFPLEFETRKKSIWLEELFRP